MKKILTAFIVILAFCAFPSGLPADETAPSWGLGPFLRPDEVNPVIRPNKESVFDCPMQDKPVHWEYSHTFNSAAVVQNGKVVVLYRSEDESGGGIGSFTSRLGMAVSTDGIHFDRFPAPVFYPGKDGQQANEWTGGCEDPRLVEGPDGTYVLTYTQWNHHSTHLAIATSRDLIHWNKHGPAFANAYGGKYAADCKSAGIVCKVDEGRLMATQINGKYWMYWGESEVHGATSNDLIDWTPVEESPGHLKALLPRRTGHFDSGLVEGGPPPVLTDKGILVIYNGKNDGSCKDLPKGAYAGGQALFDAQDPTRLLQRADDPFFKPEEPWEKTGQYAAGTTFVEGLVYFQQKWFLYYGCADTFVGVAVCDPKKQLRGVSSK